MDPFVSAMVINELVDDDDLKLFTYLWECLWGAFVAFSTDEDLRDEASKKGYEYLSFKEAIEETSGEVSTLEELKKHVDSMFE